MNVGKLQVSTPGDREMIAVRAFNAPRERVFDAFSRSEFAKQWMYGPDDWPIIDCEIDFRIGGSFRYVWNNEEHGDMALTGEYREISAPERIVNNEIFESDEDNQTIVTTDFAEQNGQTIVTTTSLYPSKEVRDGAVTDEMLAGWEQCYVRLDNLLASME